MPAVNVKYALDKFATEIRVLEGVVIDDVVIVVVVKVMELQSKKLKLQKRMGHTRARRASFIALTFVCLYIDTHFPPQNLLPLSPSLARIFPEASKGS